MIEGMRRVDVTSLPPRKSIVPMLGTLEWPLANSYTNNFCCEIALLRPLSASEPENRKKEAAQDFRVGAAASLGPQLRLRQLRG